MHLCLFEMTRHRPEPSRDLGSWHFGRRAKTKKKRFTHSFRPNHTYNIVYDIHIRFTVHNEIHTYFIRRTFHIELYLFRSIFKCGCWIHTINSMETQWTFVGCWFFFFYRGTLPISLYMRLDGTQTFFFNNKFRYIDPHSTELGTAHFCSLLLFFEPRNLFDLELVAATKSILHWNVSTNWKFYPFSMNGDKVTAPGIGFSMTNSIPFEWKNCVCVLKVHGNVPRVCYEAKKKKMIFFSVTRNSL